MCWDCRLMQAGRSPGSMTTVRFVRRPTRTGTTNSQDLRPGTYHVYQVQPEEFIDGLDTPGTTGGIAVNPADEVEEDDRIMIQTLAFSELTDPRDDAILNITLVGGGGSVNNNFSEIVIGDLQIPLDHSRRPRNHPQVTAPPIETFDPRIRLVAFANHHRLRKHLLAANDDWAVSWHLSVINGGFPRGTRRGRRDHSQRQRERDNRETGARAITPRGRWTIRVPMARQSIAPTKSRWGKRTPPHWRVTLTAMASTKRPSLSAANGSLISTATAVGMLATFGSTWAR